MTFESSFPKRALDLLISGVGLVALAPVMAVAAFAVRISSPGSVFFRQTRVGRDRSTFEILKFRSMFERSPEGVDQFKEAVVTSGSDSRVTPVGRVLRATSIDELPQLVNVLRGEMSLVGPRPVIAEQLDAMPSEYFDRFKVRPGITGLAQVNGRRQLDWIDQLKFDVKYVDSVRFGSDLVILLKTIGTVFRPSDIYGGSGSNWRSYVRDNAGPTLEHDTESENFR